MQSLQQLRTGLRGLSRPWFPAITLPTPRWVSTQQPAAREDP